MTESISVESLSKRYELGALRQETQLRDQLSEMHERHLGMIGQTQIKVEDLQGAGTALKRLERFWTRASDLVQRPQAFNPAA